MEDLDSKDNADWVAAENKVTFDYLGRLAMRDRLKQRITELWDFPKVSVPAREGGRYFYRKNSGLQRQSVLYVQANLQAEPSVVLDPNTLSPDGSLSLSDWKASPDGKLVVYGVSEGGADWETLTRRPRRTWVSEGYPFPPFTARLERRGGYRIHRYVA